MDINYFNQFSSYRETKEENKEVWVYTRVSSKEQFESNKSIENQTSAAQSYALSNDYRITETFGGTYESAKGDFTRKEFQRLIDAVTKSKKKPYAILIYKMSRFSRSGGFAIGLVTHLTEALGVHLIEVSTGKTTTTERGKHEVLESLLYAKKENLERLEITLPGMKRFVENGNWLGMSARGYDHYGPRVKDTRFHAPEQRIIINEEGKILKKAWQWKLKGEPDYLIINKLKKLGVHMSKQAVSEMWRRPFYCGISTHSFLEGSSTQGNWEPIVSVRDFITINERLKSNTNNGYQQSKKHDGRPLQSILTCSLCGCKITGYKAKKTYDYYKCQNKECNCKDMNANDSSKSKGLNTLFQEVLEGFSLNEEILPLVEEQLKLTVQRIDGDISSNRQRLLKLKNEVNDKLKKLERNSALGDVPKDVYTELKDELLQELSTYDEQLEESILEISNLDRRIKDCVSLTQNISKIWTSSDYDNKVKLQKLIFPAGLSIESKNRQYRTKKINSIFSYILDSTVDSEGQKKDPLRKNLNGSLVVAGTGLEPMSVN